MSFELAQVNIARLLASLEDPRLADFVAALEPVNAAADVAPGFLWRLQTEDGDATAIRAFEWDTADSVGVIVNMSVWCDVEHLAAFTYGEMHRVILKRRREWFQRMREATHVCWWVPAGHRPTTAEAEDRLRRLRDHGPTPFAFTLQQHFPPPSPGGSEPRPGAGDWLCPA
ncbi:DUF3291 domain-containing protein [Nocardia sp. BMG51109]|uniref:DUF3291 domain-containing protein n=1 Tax=Nocardia sp. BMG51109 TaxID=1056816 RepID=UPI0004653C55|nr:DUF3291 domain-containing protein [Nocardia sp. BMG51109]